VADGVPGEDLDAPPPFDVPLPEDRYLNRELSWLDFNARVLSLAEERARPLLERVRFLAIFAATSTSSTWSGWPG